MARLFAYNIFFFLLPFLAYAAYLLATRGSFRNISQWQAQTIAWLALGGAVLMVAALVYFTQFQAGEADSTYVPARFDNGRIIPGYLEPAAPSSEPGG
jgi:hypothetical protein